MKKLFLCGLVYGLSLSVSTAEGRTIYFGNDTEVVSIVAGEETLLKFPSDVRTISRAQRYEIQPADPEQPNYSLLKVRPRFSSGSNPVVFILNDGTTIQTKLVIAPSGSPEKTSALYEFRPKEAMLSEALGKEATSTMSDLDLMKAMIRGDEASGYDVKSVSRPVNPGFRGVNTTLIRVYTGNRFNGYVFELANTSKDKKLLINIQNLMLGEPNLAILSNVDSPLVEPGPGPKGKTLLRIVAKPTSVYSKLVLPIEVVEKKQ
jgi:hypothetical protein